MGPRSSVGTLRPTMPLTPVGVTGPLKGLSARWIRPPTLSASSPGSPHAPRHQEGRRLERVGLALASARTDVLGGRPPSDSVFLPALRQAGLEGRLRARVARRPHGLLRLHPPSLGEQVAPTARPVPRARGDGDGGGRAGGARHEPEAYPQAPPGEAPEGRLSRRAGARPGHPFSPTPVPTPLAPTVGPLDDVEREGCRGNSPRGSGVGSTEPRVLSRDLSHRQG